MGKRRYLENGGIYILGVTYNLRNWDLKISGGMGGGGGEWGCAVNGGAVLGGSTVFYK